MGIWKGEGDEEIDEGTTRKIEGAGEREREWEGDDQAVWCVDRARDQVNRRRLGSTREMMTTAPSRYVVPLF